MLDPSALSNVKFAHVKVKRTPGAAWTQLGGSGNLRGRLQSMVPPVDMASPAPVAVAFAARSVNYQRPAWV